MTTPSPREEKGRHRAALAAKGSAEMERLAAAAARSLGCAGGLEAAETVIRAGMLKLGGGMLEKLLAADPGYRGPRTRCGCGQLAEFVAYRDKTFDTVLGPVTICRAWYHPDDEDDRHLDRVCVPGHHLRRGRSDPRRPHPQVRRDSAGRPGGAVRAAAGR